jgi:amino acid transporter
MLFSLINIGNRTAFNAINNLYLVALMNTYMISIGCVLYRRVMHPELLPPARWSLGRYGTAINATALAYTTQVFFWAFWPVATPVTLDTVNWAALIFMTVLLASGTSYFFVGRKKYIGPVALVKRGTYVR